MANSLKMIGFKAIEYHQPVPKRPGDYNILDTGEYYMMHTNFSDERIDAFIDKYRTWLSLQPENEMKCQQMQTPEAFRATICASSDGLTEEDAKIMRHDYETWFKRQPSDLQWNHVSPSWFRVVIKGDPLRLLPDSQPPTYPQNSPLPPPTRLAQKRAKEWRFNDEIKEKLEDSDIVE